MQRSSQLTGEGHSRRLARRISERNRRQGGLGAGPDDAPRMSSTTCAPSPGCAGWSVAIMVSAPRMSMSSSPSPPMAWQRVGGASWEHDQPPRHGPSSSHGCAAPSLWSLPERWHATACGVSPSSVCPGLPSATGRHSARSRGCSTCRTWPSSQTSCATRCTPPSLPSPCTPKRAAGVRARAGG